MTSEEDYKERYQEIKEKVSYKQFLDDLEEMKDENKDDPFVTEDQLVTMVVEKYAGRENIQQTVKNQVQKISSLIEGNGNISIQGRLIAISNIKTFTTKKGREGKVANLTVDDNTGKIRVVMWTDNIKYINRIQEGNIIKVNNLEVRKGYTGDLEVQMRSNSTIQVLSEEVDPELPEYHETITNIEDIKNEGEYNVIVRITKISNLQEIKKEDKNLQLVKLDIMDKTGSSELTLWNKDTNLIETLELKENDTIKVIKARAQLRYEQVSLSNSWNGRIVKGEYDIPEYHEDILKIKDASEQENVIVVGVITKVYDTITFERDNGSEGKVRSIEVTDDTGSIRVTLWNKETEISMNKGDIIKIHGGNIEFDDYAGDSYRLNTGWNAGIVIDPDISEDLKEKFEEISNFKTLKIENILDTTQDEGREVDVIGRILTIGDVNEFQRVDGTEGHVRAMEIADETGSVRSSMWDEKSDIDESLGDAIKIENARTRLGQGQMELSVGKSSRITKPSDEEIIDLPTFEDLEKNRYHTKTISQLEENESNVKLKVRLMNVNEINTFTRPDGKEGKVRGIDVADSTGQIQVSLWDNQTELKISEGAAIIIENPSISFQNDTLRLSITSRSTIKQANPEEVEEIPTTRDIESKLYVEKLIEDIEEDDKNIKLKATISEVNSEKILFAMCPNCNKRVVQDENGYTCEICGETIKDPNYLMILTVVLEDETGTVQTTFFRKNAEELLNKTTDEIIKIFEATGDESSMSGNIEDLIGHEVSVIADANYNEYEEDIRLNVKKLLIVL